MTKVVTFYSYKGGVGRSMAMANIAVLLAKEGLRVLAVDWDLEAPGLERYFSYFNAKPSSEGLLHLLMEGQHGAKPNLKNYLWQIEGDIDGQNFLLNFLSSGKETDSEYAAKLERFDWKDYFAGGGGDYIETLREMWLETYDITLVDSRTGLSDAGGICTIQLPDIVVAMFTANYQSLYGVRDIMRLAQTARNDLAYDRTHLLVVPLPARFGSRTEFRESQEWLNHFSDVLKEFYQDWTPTWLEPRRVVEIMKIPQVDFFGFGEKLAVVEQGTSDPDGMGFVYDKVASLLSKDLQEIETILNIEAPSKPVRKHGKPKTARSADYDYDLYVSYAHDAILNEWLRALVDELGSWISLETGTDPRIFIDYSELSFERSLEEHMSSSLLRAKLLLAVVTPRYFTSKWCAREWATFSDREKMTNAESPLIIPLYIRGRDVLPEPVAQRQWFDMSDLPLHASAFADKKLSLRINERIQRLARAITRSLQHVPPFDPQWRVAEDPLWKLD